MTNEEKQLVLMDLCARLPYGVYVTYKINKDETERATIFNGNYARDIMEGRSMWIDFKPYLRSFSSMTEEEKDYVKNVARFKQSDGIHYDDGVHYVPIYQETLDNQWKEDGKFPPILGDIYRFMLEYGYILLFDFFNSHYLDYRGLIPMGLANEAPEGIYEI